MNEKACVNPIVTAVRIDLSRERKGTEVVVQGHLQGYFP
jgi:hypothetical protein